jgi:hypothetical protein
MIRSWFGRTISHIGTEKGPSSLGGLQWGIFGNGRKSDRARIETRRDNCVELVGEKEDIDRIFSY